MLARKASLINRKKMKETNAEILTPRSKIEKFSGRKQWVFLD